MVNPKFLQCILPFAGSTDERVINQALGLGNRLYGLVTSKAIAHHHSFGSQQELLDMFITMDDLELILMIGWQSAVHDTALCHLFTFTGFSKNLAGSYG